MYYILKSASHVSLTNQPHPFLQGAFHLTQPHPHARKRKHSRSLTVMPWTTTDEFNVILKTQRMSLASFPGQNGIRHHLKKIYMKQTIFEVIFEAFRRNL